MTQNCHVEEVFGRTSVRPTSETFKLSLDLGLHTALMQGASGQMMLSGVFFFLWG